MQIIRPRTTSVIRRPIAGQHASQHGCIDRRASTVELRGESWEDAQWYHRVQEVSSFSSIEKISPVFSSTLRTTHVRPLTSLSLASYLPGATPVMGSRSSGSTVPSLSFLH